MIYIQPWFKLISIFWIIGSIAGLFLSGCIDPVEPENFEKIENVNIDGMKIVPANRRFVSLGQTFFVQLNGVSKGYICSEISSLELKETTEGLTTILVPSIDLFFPANSGCGAITSWDTTVSHQLRNLDGEKLFLTSSSGSITDSAGISLFPHIIDTLTFLKDSTGISYLPDSTDTQSADFILDHNQQQKKIYATLSQEDSLSFGYELLETDSLLTIILGKASFNLNCSPGCIVYKDSLDLLAEDPFAILDGIE